MSRPAYMTEVIVTSVRLDPDSNSSAHVKLEGHPVTEFPTITLTIPIPTAAAYNFPVGKRFSLELTETGV